MAMGRRKPPKSCTVAGSMVLRSVHIGLARNQLCKGLPFSSENVPLGIKIEILKGNKGQKKKNAEYTPVSEVIYETVRI